MDADDRTPARSQGRRYPILIVAVVLAAAGPLLGAYWIGLLTQVMIFAILAMRDRKSVV